MEIKIVCREENYHLYKEKLEQVGFRVVDEANLVLKESNYQPQTIVGKKDEHFHQVSIDEVYLIESFGRDVYAYTNQGTFSIKYKLYEIENDFKDFGLIRINKSQIVNRHHIQKIKPLLNSRIKIILKTKQVLEISRIYQEHFREVIGF